MWRVLAAVKTEFAKFGAVLDKVKRQLDSASHTIEQTGVRTRAMERKLRSVEQLPEAEAEVVLEIPGAAGLVDVIDADDGVLELDGDEPVAD